MNDDGTGWDTVGPSGPVDYYASTSPRPELLHWDHPINLGRGFWFIGGSDSYVEWSRHYDQPVRKPCGHLRDYEGCWCMEPIRFADVELRPALDPLMSMAVNVRFTNPAIPPYIPMYNEVRMALAYDTRRAIQPDRWYHLTQTIDPTTTTTRVYDDQGELVSEHREHTPLTRAVPQPIGHVVPKEDEHGFYVEDVESQVGHKVEPTDNAVTPEDPS